MPTKELKRESKSNKLVEIAFDNRKIAEQIGSTDSLDGNEFNACPENMAYVKLALLSYNLGVKGGYSADVIKKTLHQGFSIGNYLIEYASEKELTTQSSKKLLNDMLNKDLNIPINQLDYVKDYGVYLAGSHDVDKETVLHIIDKFYTDGVNASGGEKTLYNFGGNIQSAFRNLSLHAPR